MSKINAKVIADTSTIIQLREGSRSIAQLKLSRADHMPVIEGLIDVVLQDGEAKGPILEALMDMIRRSSKPDFA